MACDERLDLETRRFDDVNHHRWRAGFRLRSFLDLMCHIAEKQGQQLQLYMRLLTLCPTMIAQNSQVCLSVTILKETDHPVDRTKRKVGSHEGRDEVVGDEA